MKRSGVSVTDATSMPIDNTSFYITNAGGVYKIHLPEVDAGKYKVAFILNPTGADEVLKVAKNHERMPQKATDFYPEMISGFTMLSLEEGEKLL